jgi:hypothetical protein
MKDEEGRRRLSGQHQEEMPGPNRTAAAGTGPTRQNKMKMGCADGPECGRRSKMAAWHLPAAAASARSEAARCEWRFGTGQPQPGPILMNEDGPLLHLLAALIFILQKNSPVQGRATVPTGIGGDRVLRRSATDTQCPGSPCV